MASTKASTDGGRYMTTEEVCALYKVTVRTVYRWRQRGHLHGVKVGRRVLFDRDEVEAFAHLRECL